MIVLGIVCGGDTSAIESAKWYRGIILLSTISNTFLLMKELHSYSSDIDKDQRERAATEFGMHSWQPSNHALLASPDTKTVAEFEPLLQHGFTAEQTSLVLHAAEGFAKFTVMKRHDTGDLHSSASILVNYARSETFQKAWPYIAQRYPDETQALVQKAIRDQDVDSLIGL